MSGGVCCRPAAPYYVCSSCLDDWFGLHSATLGSWWHLSPFVSHDDLPGNERITDANAHFSLDDGDSLSSSFCPGSSRTEAVAIAPLNTAYAASLVASARLQDTLATYRINAFSSEWRSAPGTQTARRTAASKYEVRQLSTDCRESQAISDDPRSSYP
ncbi:hypothetical protein GY45DRAFT_365979 [Cubamyces sp. BRFM 1775]|nr:hypothetical protein GY45DRAFT_365979 [Cubamyces sp. BRFM 1775]